MRNVLVWFKSDSEHDLADCLISLDIWLASSRVLTACTLSVAMDDKWDQKKQVDGRRKRRAT